MGDVGDQVAAQLFLAVQGIGHLVERGRQLAQLSERSHAPPAASAMTEVSSSRSRLARAETSAEANAAVSPASNAIAANATAAKTKARRSAMGPGLAAAAAG